MNDNKEIFGLEFKSFEVFRASFERNSLQKEYVLEAKIAREHVRDEDNPDDFQVHFNINFGTKDSEASLYVNVEAIGFFKLIGAPSPEVIENYFNISAPSIVYPYIRAFISNLSVQSGINAIVLPPVNFAQFHNEEKEA